MAELIVLLQPVMNKNAAKIPTVPRQHTLVGKGSAFLGYHALPMSVVPKSRNHPPRQDAKWWKQR
ncbi:hypothetical protein OESDEN_22335 [Oesophagostomum dentatum]|uniref:Uncharacterized protein n=1 Tax=Oesophagostomum dentatum TaxID=61180 RepID=A0A0B1S491_OESDE|nr:hypothetical protein OESDEN_22335 [Oesophagostomum dentatum]